MTVAPYGTHLAPLTGCVAHTAGPVLELGSGLFSTSVLHAICGRRTLVTADSDATWMDRLRYLESPTHRFELVQDWASYAALDESWSVALVDQSPGHTRRMAIERLRERTEFLVVHDTQAVEHYGFEPLLSSFAYRQDFVEAGLHVRTTVVSDSSPIPVQLDLMANHERACSLGDCELDTTDSWTSAVVMDDVRGLPSHFMVTAELSLDDPAATCQMLFRTARPDHFFWFSIAPTRARGPAEAMLISEEAAVVGAPEWREVTSVEVRARSSTPSRVRFAEGAILALPPVRRA